MLRTRIPALLLAFFILLPVSFLYSQCLTAPPLDNCSGSEPSLSDNEILTTGVKKWYYGAPAVYNQVTIRNGTLVVCGDLTFTNFILDSGTVIIRPGARLRFGGGAGIVLRGNAAIYNYGTVEITSNLSLDGTYATAAKPNIVMNVTADAVFKMSNQYFVINNPNSWFVNRGQADFWGIITDYNAGAGSVCLGRYSQTNMSVLYNNSKNTYTAPEGGACVHVDQYSQFRDTLTNNANVNICLGNTHYSDSSCIPWGCKPNAWGTASIFQFCSTCNGLELLTLQLLGLQLVKKDGGNLLSWHTNMQAGQYLFAIERSADGKHFYIIDSISLNKLNRTEFSFLDDDPPAGLVYYRIRYKHSTTRQEAISNTLTVYSANTAGISITPNPFNDHIRISGSGQEKLQQVVVYNVAGIPVYSKVPEPGNNSNVYLDLPACLPEGPYFMKLVYTNEVIIKQIIKAF